MRKKEKREHRSPGSVLFPVLIVLAILLIIPTVRSFLSMDDSQGYLYYEGQVYACKLSIDRYAKSDFDGELEEVGRVAYVQVEDPEELTEDFQTTVKLCDEQRVYRLSSRPDDLIVYRAESGNCPYLLFLPME